MQQQRLVIYFSVMVSQNVTKIVHFLGTFSHLADLCHCLHTFFGESRNDMSVTTYRYNTL